MTEQIKHCDRKELKGKCSLYKTANLQDCIDCNRALQKPMTERIKSAIEDFQEWIDRAEEFNPNVQSDRVKAMKLAIRSLQAWEEVLEELKECSWDWITRNKIIDIIKQKLAEIEEVR